MPRPTRLIPTALLCLAAAAVIAAETKEQLTAKLWPTERIEAALAAVEKQKAAGLLSGAAYARRKTMLQNRLAGRFKPTMLSVTNPPINFIQNATGLRISTRTPGPTAAAGSGGTDGRGAATTRTDGKTDPPTSTPASIRPASRAKANPAASAS